MTGALHVHVRFTCVHVIYFSKTLIFFPNRPIQYPMLFTSFCEVEHRATKHLNISAKNIYESCRKEERKSGMSVSLKTEWLQRTQLMAGVNRRRIWRVLRDIKYYKINTGNSVLIRGKKMGFEHLPKYNRHLNTSVNGHTVTTMSSAIPWFGF